MIRAFCKLVERHAKHGMVVCEVGCNDGSTTQGYAPTVAQFDGRLILVDWFKGTETGHPADRHGYRPSEEDQTKLHAQLMEKVGPFLSRVTVLRGDSVEMAGKVEDGSLDICFIDADHRYSHVSRDIAAWEPKVRKGGIICGHDCDVYPPPCRFTEEQLASDTCAVDIPNADPIELHAGVVQAVWERYGSQATIIDDAGGEDVACWVVQL